MEIPAAPTLSDLSGERWDLLVIGGGITGAAIMREAARRGQRVLLVERGDFAEGTSSRSSKLIHGGLHYLARGQIGLARALVRERERLLRESDGLVSPIEFLLPLFPGERMRQLGVGVGLGVYEACAGRLGRPHHLDHWQVGGQLGGVGRTLAGAYIYHDAAVDDARLVLRLIRDARQAEGCALSYVMACSLIRDRAGRVVGAILQDREQGYTQEVQARAVVNATGPWADRLRGDAGGRPRVRLVRGSHLIFAGARLPLDRAVVIRHPDSDQAFYAIPWEGATIIGSTSIDETAPTADHARISEEEIDYLLRGVRWLFPSLALTEGDILSTYAGERAIVDRSTRDAAKASRHAAVWEDSGMLTVVGGKMTSFQLIAEETLRRLGSVPNRVPVEGNGHGKDDAPEDWPFDRATAARLQARYGRSGLREIAAMPADERCPIPGQRTLWGELRWAARGEEVHHLSDLLLRRVRLGLTAPGGGLALAEAARSLIQPELGWDNARWDAEFTAYAAHWRQSHSPFIGHQRQRQSPDVESGIIREPGLSPFTQRV